MSQLETAHYHNIKHGIKRDLGASDLVLPTQLMCHLTFCHGALSRDDEECEADGALKHAASEYIVVRVTGRSASAPKWNVAKLFHPTPGKVGWVIQWLNTN